MKKYTLALVILIYFVPLSNAQRTKNCRECIEDIEPVFRAKISKLQADKLKAEQEVYNYRTGKIKSPSNPVPVQNQSSCNEQYWKKKFNSTNSQLRFYKSRLIAATDTIHHNVKEKNDLESSLRAENKEIQGKLDKSLSQIDKQDSIIFVLISEKAKNDSTIYEREREKIVVTKLFGKNSLQVFAEYNPRFGKKRYVPLDSESPIREAANLDPEVKIDAKNITRLLIIGSILLEDDADRLSGDVFLKFKNGSNASTNKTASVIFIKQNDKVGKSSVYTCRFNEPSLIWDKFGKNKKRTILNNNEDYTIEITCKDQTHSTKFRLD